MKMVRRRDGRVNDQTSERVGWMCYGCLAVCLFLRLRLSSHEPSLLSSSSFPFWSSSSSSSPFSQSV